MVQYVLEVKVKKIKVVLIYHHQNHHQQMVVLYHYHQMVEKIKKPLLSNLLLMAYKSGKGQRINKICFIFGNALVLIGVCQLGPSISLQQAYTVVVASTANSEPHCIKPQGLPQAMCMVELLDCTQLLGVLSYHFQPVRRDYAIIITVVTHEAIMVTSSRIHMEEVIQSVVQSLKIAQSSEMNKLIIQVLTTTCTQHIHQLVVAFHHQYW